MNTTKYIFVIIGPAGCGKTTLAEYLAQETGLPVIEGDDVASTPKSKEVDQFRKS